MSNVIKLLDLVWINTNDATVHSYERLNDAMRNALTMAIGSGFAFNGGDFTTIMTKYHTGHWTGESQEWCYTLAVTVGNLSAATAFEKYMKRGPFIADDVNVNGYSEYLHNVGDRQRERLAVGFSFPWKMDKATVTSFSADRKYVNACAYENVKYEECKKCHNRIEKQRCAECHASIYDYSRRDDRKPRKRFKISREDIIQWRAQCKEEFRAKIEADAEKREQQRKLDEDCRVPNAVLGAIATLGEKKKVVSA